METIQVELFANVLNSAVLRIPNRCFPGVVIQGDSLAILYRLATEIHRRSLAEYQSSVNEHEDSVADLAGELKELLAGYLGVYEATLKTHNMQLPYTGPLVSQTQTYQAYKDAPRL